MSDFLTRLEEEQRELQIKIDALKNFISDKDNFAKVGGEQYILLKSQLIIMNSYNEILIERLKFIHKHLY